MRFILSFIILLMTNFYQLSGQNLSKVNIPSKKLANGLEVFVIKDSTVPMVNIELAVKNGSFTDTDQFNGLSHLYEHLFFKTNKVYSDYNSMARQINQLELSENAPTREEVVNYYFNLPAENFKEDLKFMNTAARHPWFSKESLAKEAKVVDSEFTLIESDPLYVLRDAEARHLWGTSYSRKNIIGNHKVILSATPAKMDSIRLRYYWPNNCALIIVGDINVEYAFKDVENIFASWKHSEFDPFVQWPIPEIQPLQETQYYVVETNKTPVP